jgi:predicted enzyme involved in methoxymalonyl-ACP biosynthesis
MSVIKEIYDVAKDTATLTTKASALKRALKAELKLNKKILADIQHGAPIDNDRRIAIINMLDVEEIAAAVRYEIPYAAISRKKVTEELVERYKIKRIVGYDLEKLIEGLHLMISYLKKDCNNPRIDLNLRLINIYKYTAVLVELLG